MTARSVTQRACSPLEPKIRTIVVHTWFLRRDYDGVTSTKLEDNPYIVALSLAEVDCRAATMKSRIRVLI